MSSPERQRRVILSPKARQDFIDILRYTGATWGKGQLHSYRDKIDDALQAIGHEPESGHHRDDLPSTPCCLAGSRHRHRTGSALSAHPPPAHEPGAARLKS
jgi:plasmid stabilization system protein ParE